MSENRPEKPPGLGNPIPRSISIEADKGKVWQLISEPGNLANCHPFCADNPVERWPGVGSRDTIVYYSGWALIRDFTSWIDGTGYDLYIGEQEGGQSKVSWRLEEIDEYMTSLSITIWPYLEENNERNEARFGRLLGKYLESVLQGYKYYLETGQPVRRNQFGSHRMFSPPVSSG